MKKILIAVVLLGGALGSVFAELKMPAIFTDHLVLQRDIPVNVWGWDAPGQDVTVQFAGQSVVAKAGSDGKWKAKLQPLETSAVGRQIKVTGSTSKLINDVLVGEVWLCSGQSNMEFAVANAYNGDLETLAAKYPLIRHVSVPKNGTQKVQDDFVGQWEVCSPESIGQFSAVGYFFGRTLHQTLGVPIGLIDNSWGGSAAEAWVPREVLAADDDYKTYLDDWSRREKTVEADTAAWVKALEAWRQAGAQGRPPQSPVAQMTGNSRPGNIYNGGLHPLIGYGLRGAIWYQGESNAARAYNYRKLFPLMITQWRKEWGQGDFPFFWVQLADFKAEQPTPMDSAWAELQEAQTMTLKLPNTGQAVINDVGEGKDIHPRDKETVAKRLARHALAKVYGFSSIQADSPRYASHEIAGNKIVVTFQQTGSRGLNTFDVADPRGFAIAGEDQKFVWANAKIVAPDKIEVWADAVAKPIAVRYAWADNPVCNVRSQEGLPLTPFRTDDWNTTTKPQPVPAAPAPVTTAAVAPAPAPKAPAAPAPAPAAPAAR
jgi:sialate O-acetylesterase